MTHQQLIDKPLKPCIPHFEWLWPWVINPSELSAWFMKAESCCQEIPRFSAGLELTAQQTPVWLWIKTLYIPPDSSNISNLSSILPMGKKGVRSPVCFILTHGDVPSGSVMQSLLLQTARAPWFFLGLSHFHPFPSISIHFHSFPFISIHFHSFPFISIQFHSVPFISIHFHSFPFISIHFHSFPFISFISIHFHSFPFISIHFHSFPFISIHFHSFPFISIHFHSFPFISIHFHSFPSISIHFHSFPFISIHFHSFPFISIHFHSFPFISIHFHPCFCVCPTFLLLERQIFQTAPFLPMSSAGIFWLPRSAKVCCAATKNAMEGHQGGHLGFGWKVDQWFTFWWFNGLYDIQITMELWGLETQFHGI